MSERDEELNGETEISNWSSQTTQRPYFIVAIVTSIIAVIAIVLALVVVLSEDETPGDDSVEAGFARSMSTHHGQAVLMAGIVYQRTEDPVIRTLAYDILTTQQAQIGMMGGWLSLWGLSSSGSGPAMAWMGHSMDGPMPGLASDEDIESLRTLPPAEMDRLFLQVMIVHHQAGAEMARSAFEHSSEPHVKTTARFMAESQTGEIATMQQLLSERTT